MSDFCSGVDESPLTVDALGYLYELKYTKEEDLQNEIKWVESE